MVASLVRAPGHPRAVNLHIFSKVRPAGCAVGVWEAGELNETVLAGKLLSAGQAVVFYKLHLRAKCNRNVFQDSHYANLSPKSGTLFPAPDNVKQKPFFS
jgi:hypothetical protein